MHELGLMESAIRAAIGEMERRGAGRIHSMTLRIGELAAVDPEALRFAFEALRPGTPLEAAELVVEPVAGVAWCRHCEHEFTTGTGHIFKCPHCGEFTAELRGGREIELARLELSE